ncbi:NAD(P)-dependent oxidoreductase [Nocardia sp. NPDC052112]|uniref:NAD(P)-dependent oxidoreductase n=1 Tax=Nocardia sp. NPDC052112 TaxID=3155646 RepID=UPI003432E714
MSRSKPRLLVLDDWEGRLRRSAGYAHLRELADASVLDGPIGELTDEELRGVQIVMAVRERTRFDRELFDRMPNLELILQTGGHAYHIDQVEAARRGISVPLWRRSDACEAAVRELTIGLMIAALRKLPAAIRDSDAGLWNGHLGATLRGRRIGILGMGLQGRAVARLAQAFDMEVVTWARPGSSTTATDGIPRLSMEELLGTSDVVSVHLRLSDESRGLLTADRLRSMKPGSVLVNTARGAIVDEAALAEVLRDGPLRAAGLDVFAHEPLPADSPLRTLPNVVLTPHIGWTVEEAFEEFATGAAEQLHDYLANDLDPRELAFQPDVVVYREAVGSVRA